MTTLVTTLFQAHASAQRGFYFDALSEPREGLFIATSNIIEDPFWNYAFGAEESLEANVDLLPSIFAESISSRCRVPAMLLVDGSSLENHPTVSNSYSPFADDLWMTAETAQFSAKLPDGLIVSPIKTPSDRASAVEVFADAYTTASEDGVGYSGLPAEYTQTFVRGLERAVAFRSDHLIGRSRGEAVAIASVFYAGGTAGLYSVAVSRHARLRGYGSAISRAALEIAQRKAEIAFLQTEPDSPVQQMYERAGFRKLVLARLWSPSAVD
jgi:ribosomal protein S18 acetylase RimI-like enzyme